MTTQGSRRITAMARRSKAAVGTVVNSDHGRAACAANVKLFEQVEFSEGPVPYAKRLEAAAVCDSCPLRAGYGFRITNSRKRSKGAR
ncbi:hypothetical protein E1265_09595 [Streptomyces sp. 8K308]|uniref:hypothetical protein n=1 Tax=Streptomyces sp. 8K308 TaxID=2530388 RepID=UPI001047ADDB|nr:hypothetical protein [Streptomyces sp. 8K308]TDC24481.1 hypothetical protein E1265_09595 [Streptomyces sp. 8K308]